MKQVGNIVTVGLKVLIKSLFHSINSKHILSTEPRTPAAVVLRSASPHNKNALQHHICPGKFSGNELLFQFIFICRNNNSVTINIVLRIPAEYFEKLDNILFNVKAVLVEKLFSALLAGCTVKCGPSTPQWTSSIQSLRGHNAGFLTYGF